MTNTSNDSRLIDVSKPGLLPFVDLKPSDFGDLVAKTREIVEELGWIVTTPVGPMILGYAQAKKILRDPNWFSVLAGISMLDNPQSPSIDIDALLTRAQKSVPEVPTTFKMRPNVLSVEGEDHRRLRRLVNSSFTSGGADRLRPFMREHANSLVESLCKLGGGDLVKEFCRPYPIPIICRLLGVDDSDWELFDHWAETIFSALDIDADAAMTRLGDVTKAQMELDVYVSELIETKSNFPDDGLISELTNGHIEGDYLSRDELIAMVEALLLAGTDTTRNQLGATLAVLADHPEEYKKLRENRDLIPSAVEESLRYIGTVRSTARLASKDLVVDEVFFPAGTTVILGLHAAGLSEVENNEGYCFQIDRSISCPHLAFGSGTHHCLGAFLARAELQEALGAFVDQVETFNLSSPVSWKPLSMGIWGPSHLEIEVRNNFDSDLGSSHQSGGTVSRFVDSDFQKTSSSQDFWIRESALKRRSLQSTIPELVKKPTFPPIFRLFRTVWEFGRSFVLWKIVDRRKVEFEKKAILYSRFRRSAERLGPTYIKLAQLISAAEGVFPESLIAECKKCRDRVEPESWTAIKKVLDNELGSTHKTFNSINEEPLAAASIAQVHQAELLDGNQVVIKVQRPEIRKKVTADLRVMSWIAPRLIGRIPISALSNPPALVELFAETICEELDFQLEVANLFEVHRALRANPRHHWEVPEPFLDLVTEKIIVMSRLDGISLNDLQKISHSVDDVASIFRQMVESLLEGAVIHGVFHGDFHAGNIFIDNSKGIGLVDFGITGRLDGQRRIAFLRYAVGLMTGDLESQIIGVRDLGAFPKDIDIEALIVELQLDRVDFDPLELSEEEFVEQLQDLIKELLRKGARIPKELMLFIKNFAYLSSVVQTLDPDMDILKEFSDIASNFLARNGVRVATEIGFSVSPNDASDDSIRRVVGLRDNATTLTWRELGDRRASMLDRLKSFATISEE